MKYAPLPWVHLSDALRPSLRRIRIVLEQPAFSAERTFVRLYDGPRSEQITDARLLLDSQTPLSARERAAISILHEAGPSHAKKGRFALTRAQVGRLLAFATEVALEVDQKGGLVVVPQPARILGQITENEEGQTQLGFNAIDNEGHAIHEPQVLGEREAYLLDPQLKLHRITPPLLPGEAKALIESEPLILNGLTTEEGKSGFEAVVGLGVDLAEIVEVAHESEPPAQMWLRALLTSEENGHKIGIRVHLVTELGMHGFSDEVEVSSRGAIPPVCAIQHPDDHEAPAMILTRPTIIEEEARQCLFDMGLRASGQHRGFAATGENALDILVQISQRENIPEFIQIDTDTLPQIIYLPKVPILNAIHKPDSKRNLLEVNLDIGPGIIEAAISLDQIITAAAQGRKSLYIDEDTVLGFTKEMGRSIELIGDALELRSLTDRREIGQGELALLVAALGGNVNLKCPDDVRAHIEAFLADPNEDDRRIPSACLATLRPYQLDGVAWMSHLHRLSLGRILADDMGLGKTLMTLCLLAKAKEDDGQMPTLVVAPTSVIDVWIGEAAKHVPTLKTLKWHGRDRRHKEEDARKADIVITSYALLRRDVDNILGRIKFRYLMLDEAQHVKNHNTEAWKAARQVNCIQRLALTGTPIENRVEELWSILEIVAPGLLGTARSFEKRYGRPIAKGNAQRLDELRRRTKPVILRRKKEDVAKDLPPKIETILRCEMEDDQRALYLRVLAEVRSDVEKALSLENKSRGRAPILAALMRLRQVCCDPYLILRKEKDPPTLSSTKLKVFEEIVTEALAAGRKIIVFSQFVEMQKLIHGVLKKIGVDNALWLHGGTKKRGEVVAAFQDENGPPVIVVSLKAGGTGVTLTRADMVIHYDPWWNPAVEDQATDRAHRIGQSKTVHVIKLACSDSIEERMLSLGAKKRAAAEGVLGRDGPGPRGLSVDEIRNIIEDEAARGF